MHIPSHGVGDKWAAAGEDSSVFVFPWIDGEWSSDLSHTNLTPLNGWNVPPQSERLWLFVRADAQKPQGPGNDLWAVEDLHRAHHNPQRGTEVFACRGTGGEF
jgi:hypothetical protein